ncbi:hypothetical protein PLESTB_000327800 [Pleodorina starrii]|uniref:F5/8 type C domain-containing protein n=1 Tax=Pleodorina starrii TaxID=330485 RepID=A0A9W6EZ65_9CHLO|nr:hypothetical protein PLESTB_000327800 [Pleodorina starrii]GLC75091.1 hypothetical protein PLESTF_001593000 [Pleodorina starrii]
MRVGTWPIRTTNDSGAVAKNSLVWQQNGGGSGAIPAYQVVFSTPVVGRWITVQNFRSGVAAGEAVLAIAAVCPTQPGWCEHPGSTLEMVNCDNDGIMDLVCTDVYGRRGVRLSSKSCVSDDASTGWPMAPSSLCPAKIPVNLALGKTSYASSNYINIFPASYAVDGNMDTFMHTAFEDSAKWLSIDLGSVMKVTRIVLWNRQDCCPERLANAEVRAGATVIRSNADAALIGQNPVVWRQAAAPAPPAP